MKFYRCSSLLERILAETDIYGVDLSINDFHSVLGDVTRGHYDHGRYPDFKYYPDIKPNTFEVSGITINLVENEPDDEN